MKKKTLHLQYNSPVVLSFALVSLGALLLNLFTHGRSNTLLFSVYRSSRASCCTSWGTRATPTTSAT